MRARLVSAREALFQLTARLARLCEFLLSRWSLFMALCLIFAALCFLPFGLELVGLSWSPSWWWLLSTALTGLPAFLCVAYMLHPLPPSPGWRFSQQPTSPLGQAEIVLVDTSLLTDGRKEILITLPLEPTPVLSTGPETLPLAQAIACTATLQNQETALILLDAAAAMGVSPEEMTRLHPLVDRTQLGPLPGVIIRDDEGLASYFVGDPIALSKLCDTMDGRHPRPLTREDRTSIAQFTQIVRQKGGLALGFAFMDAADLTRGPVYLGALSMRDVVSEDAELAVDALLEAGYHLQTQPIDERYEPPMRLAALRQHLWMTAELYAPHVILSTALLDTRALCIAAADRRHRRFDMPLLLAREWFSKVAAWLRLALGTALPLLLACVLGPAHPLHCLGMLALLGMGLASAASEDQQWDAACLVLLILGGLLRLFLIFAKAVPAGPAMGLFAVVAAWMLSLHLARRWRMILLCVLLGLLLLALCWLLPGLSLLGGLLAVLSGLLAGFSAGQLLRMTGS